jgi:AmpE protein
MNFLVILLCVLSERYLVHAVAYYRFYWFKNYVNYIERYLPISPVLNYSAILLCLIILPPILIVGLFLLLFSQMLAGFGDFLISIIVFYYCMGPENIFYPINNATIDSNQDTIVGNYLVNANHQLFGVVFWFLLAGPIGIVFYRLVYLCQGYDITRPAARSIAQVLDWFPARLTLILYLLVGNFQQGFHYLKQNFLTAPNYTDRMLFNGSLQALHTDGQENVSLAYGQRLVTHAVFIYLIAIAILSLVFW